MGGGVYTPQADTSWADIPLGRHPTRQTPPQPPPLPPEMATAVDGTHPTGMHSSLPINTHTHAHMRSHKTNARIYLLMYALTYTHVRSKIPHTHTHTHSVCLSTRGGGACVVTPGDVRGCSGGGMCGCSRGGAVRGLRRDTEIRSMSGRYASYWNAFLFW